MIKIAVRLLKRLIVIPITCFVLLVSSFLLPINSPVNAQEPIIPEPCKNAIDDPGVLTDNYMVDNLGNPISSDLILTRFYPGNPGDNISIPENITFTVDFSKLQAIFGATNSEYQEGDFQSEQHRTDSILNLNTQNFNKYHGPGQKAAPKGMVDDLKVGYVQHIYTNPHLPEAFYEYTDINGEGAPQRIYDLVETWGTPTPPQAGESRKVWLEEWGKYWPKIPTAYTEYYKGELQFRQTNGNDAFDLAKNGLACPIDIRTIEFVMPEFNRTSSITDQLNQIVVPCSAQSFRHGNTDEQDECGANAQVAGVKDSNENNGLVSSFIEKCKFIIKTTAEGFAQKVKKTISFLNKVEFTQTAYAKEKSCITLFAEGKQGSAPFCALPADQLAPGDSCTNYIDNFKLDKENPNVICTFTVPFNFNGTIITEAQLEDIKQQQEDYENNDDPSALPPPISEWNSCGVNDVGIYGCSTIIRIFPVFRIPFLAEIWNNTLYSDKKEMGVQTNQISGRPGIFSNFIPKAIDETLFPKQSGYEKINALYQACFRDGPDDVEACDEFYEILDEIVAQGLLTTCPSIPGESDIERALKCFGLLLDKTLPGQVPNEDENIKERFVGAVDCGKTFVRDISLKPLALQKEIGITSQDCTLEANAPPEGVTPGGPGEPPLPPVTDCTSSSDGDPSNGTETSREELECYIIDIASGEIDPLSGDNLADLMRRMMGKESNGNQCAVGGDDEIGVFQYTALTWKLSSEVVMGSDSGSGNITTQSRPACWGIPGEDPNLHPTDLQRSWSLNFGASNIDGGAWDPFKQIRAAREKILDSGACIWSSYSGYGYADRSQGLHPEQCFP